MTVLWCFLAETSLEICHQGNSILTMKDPTLVLSFPLPRHFFLERPFLSEQQLILTAIVVGVVGIGRRYGHSCLAPDTGWRSNNRP